MRKPAIMLILIALLFIGLTVINAATEKLAINSVLENIVDSVASIEYLTDGSLNTVWEIAATQPAVAEIRLDVPAVIEGIQLYGQY